MRDLMANSYKYAEISDQARIKGLKEVDKTIEKYHYMQVQHFPLDWIEVFSDWNRIRNILHIEESEK